MEYFFTLNEINQAASYLIDKAGAKKIWAIHGEMGAGKTTLIHSVCEMMGVTSTISSPTYAIINEYISNGEDVIYHMDWYRLKDEEEALQAGVEDCLLSGNLCLVEWPARAPGLLSDDTFHVELRVVDEHTRAISF